MTKRKRLSIYKKMLEQFKDLEKDFPMGFCRALALSIPPSFDCSIKDLPELMAYKPRSMYSYRSTMNDVKYRFATRYWWIKYNSKKRIKILKEIIDTISKKSL